MAKGYKNDDGKGDFMGAALAMFLAIVSILALIWIVGSNKIVWASLKPMLFFGSMWKWFPSDFAYERWNFIVLMATTFSRNPTDVGFMSWVGFVNLASTPFVIFLSLAYAGFFVFVLTKKKVKIFRVFQPVQLLEHTKHVFPGVAPVIKIRKAIVDNKLPGWRIQVTPEEVFSGRHNGQPMVQNNELREDVALGYFAGIDPNKTADGRMYSRMLGWQVVDLPRDSKRSGKICFPDRMSDLGRALFALWSCVAFGGEEGKEEYKEYCAKLNFSAYGSPTGSANLTVAQPLYDKYRNNRQAANLFAIHHWEHTVLFALLEIAQRRGRYTTAEVLWARPMNRVMFFALNSCGSKTPHVEAAATFSQVAYEKACRLHKRLPLMKMPDGELRHFISVNRAVRGLKEGFDHWKVSIDDRDEWWLDEALWRGRDAAMTSVLNEYRVGSMQSVPSAPAPEDSAFDVAARADQAKADQQEADQIKAASSSGNPIDFF